LQQFFRRFQESPTVANTSINIDRFGDSVVSIASVQMHPTPRPCYPDVTPKNGGQGQVGAACFIQVLKIEVSTVRSRPSPPLSQEKRAPPARAQALAAAG
jgi:hypothetical protein